MLLFVQTVEGSADLLLFVQTLEKTAELLLFVKTLEASAVLLLVQMHVSPYTLNMGQNALCYKNMLSKTIM